MVSIRSKRDRAQARVVVESCPPENRTSAPSGCMALLLFSKLAAHVAATVAVDGDAVKPRTFAFDLAPDPCREILHRCGPKIVHSVEKAMIEHAACFFECALEEAEIDDHAADGIGTATHHDF